MQITAQSLKVELQQVLVSRDELASFHSITSSARPSSVIGATPPSTAMAVCGQLRKSIGGIPVGSA
jgi:hypothetical protein